MDKHMCFINRGRVECKCCTLIHLESSYKFCFLQLIKLKEEISIIY